MWVQLPRLNRRKPQKAACFVTGYSWLVASGKTSDVFPGFSLPGTTSGLVQVAYCIQSVARKLNIKLPTLTLVKLKTLIRRSLFSKSRNIALLLSLLDQPDKVIHNVTTGS